MFLALQVFMAITMPPIVQSSLEVRREASGDVITGSNAPQYCENKPTCKCNEGATFYARAGSNAIECVESVTGN